MIQAHSGATPRISLPDALLLAGAVLVLIGCLVLPWVNLGDDGTVTGLELITAPPRPLQNNASGMFLVLTGGIIGLVFGLFVLIRPRYRRVLAAVALVGGGLVLVHFLLLLVNNSANLEPIFNPASFGFWLALIGAVLLVVQTFLARPHLDDEVRPAGFYFLLPGVVWVLFFTLFPLLYSLALAFTDMRLGRDTSFIGFQNFVEIPADLRVQETVVTSLFLSVFSVLVTVVAGTFIAWLFNRSLPGLRYFRTIMTIPLFAAPIAVGFLGKVLFNEVNGPINYFLQGIGFSAVPWFTEPVAARVGVLLVDVWQWTPFVFIVVLAAMQSISDEMYEAARLDTTSGFQIFRFITFPMILPALGTVAILRLVETLKILDIPLAMTDGGPGTATQTYSYYTYVKGLGRSFDLGYASALAYVLVIIAIIVTTIYFSRVRERFD